MQRERIASFLLFNKYKENQRELRVQANFDHLSGVILRSTFMDLLQKAIEQPECTDLFIGLVDIDYFKQINDNYGHRLSQLRFSCGVIHYLNNLSNVDQLYQKAD
ncbi:signal transduction diguanylate cyclase [Lactobacillus delbrueckii subsp. jakobsenii ZN7a-9 = DSM 26046]|uniref:GGDEF domain-containing protein n=1 Tax=Lactobacillus delbrueckii TaxID=1584 RepID=UPI0003A442C8|nr:GGDEF domain-containing protein [Lactobacillus delbrueckii]KRO18720.1 signal transduction diguanylate cyclase [Lactobacillus delbrueckii subsp. jakobsenii ZN7a-9 = DSM 26046]TDG63764.1 hypothetical protein C5L19_000323 [Lactobacillus delbrueckii subsp. jakobsenii]